MKYIFIIILLLSCSPEKQNQSQEKFHKFILFFNFDSELAVEYEGTGHLQNATSNGDYINIKLEELHIPKSKSLEFRPIQEDDIDCKIDGKVTVEKVEDNHVAKFKLNVNNKVDCEIVVWGIGGNLKKTTTFKPGKNTFLYEGIIHKSYEDKKKNHNQKAE